MILAKVKAYAHLLVAGLIAILAGLAGFFKIQSEASKRKLSERNQKAAEAQARQSQQANEALADQQEANRESLMEDLKDAKDESTPRKGLDSQL